LGGALFSWAGKYLLQIGSFYLLLCGTVWADTTESTWSGSSSTDWNTTANWNNGLTSSTTSAVFNGTFTNQPNLGSNNITAQGIWVTGNSNTGVGGLTTIGGTGTLTVIGTATLNGNTFSGILLDGSGNNSLTITAPVTITNSVTTFAVNNLGTLTVGAISLGGNTLNPRGTSASGSEVFNGVISDGTGQGSVTVSGSGTVTLSAANTFTGTLTLYNGTLVGLGTNTGTLGAGTLALGGGNLDLKSTTATGVNYGLNTGIISNAQITSDNSVPGVTGDTYTFGTLSIGAQTLTIAGGANVTSGTAGVTFGATTFTGNASFAINNPTSGGKTLLTLGSLTSTSTRTITLSGNGALTLGTAAGTIANGTTLTVGSSNTLNLNNATALGTAVTKVTDNGAIVLGADTNLLALTGSGSVTNGSNTLTISAASSDTYGGVIGNGSGGLTKAGFSTLILSGTNTYTGATTISSGTLQLGSGGATGTLSLNSTITDNGNLTINRSNAVAQGTDFTATGISGNGSFTQAGNGTTTLTSVNTYLGSTTISSGTLTIGGSGSLGSGNYAGNISNNGAFNYSSSANQTLSGMITGGGSLILSGGATLLLSGTNSYTGGTTVSSGMLQLSGVGTLGGSGSSLTMNTGGSVDVNGTNQTVGNFTGPGGTILNNFSGTNKTYTIGGGNATGGNYFGVIEDNSGTGGTLALTKIGTGTLTLSGSNTYSGPTTVSVGTLQLASETALYNNVPANWTAAKIIVSSGATLALNVGGTGQFTSSDLNTLLSLGNASGGFASGSTVALDTTNASGGNFTYSGAIANPNGSSNSLSLVKLGTNALTLSGANTYSGGTTIQNGVLSINFIAAVGSAQSLGVGGAVIFSGASSSSPSVLQYSGGTSTLGQNLTVSAGDYGIINNAGAGVLTLGGTISKNGSVLTLAGGNFVVAGTITGTSGGSNFNVGSAVYPGSTKVGFTTANSYNGSTTISAGSTLLLAVNGALPTSTPSALVLGSSSDTSSQTNTLDLLGTSQTIGSLTSTGNGINQVISSNGLATTPAVGAGASGSVGSLTINYASGVADVFSGTLGGTGTATNFSLTKSGSGTLVLTGANTYTGSTTISAGSLQLGNGGTTGALSTSSTITDNGNLTINRSNAVTQGTDFTAGAITGSGSLTQAGTGMTTLTAANTYTGATTIDFGVLAVQGASASIGSANSAVNVGYNSGDNGTLQISNGGKVTGSQGNIGAYSGSTGAAAVSGVSANGTASTWNAGYTDIGGGGGGASGTLTISDGGLVTSSNGNLLSGSSVTVNGVNASGVDSTWTVQQTLNVNGSGLLTIQNGGQVSDYQGFLSSGTGLVTGVNANGTASKWSNGPNFYVGDYGGTAALTIQDGAQVVDTVGFIGDGDSGASHGTVTVTGVNANGTASTWTNGASSLYVGYHGGTGTLTIQDGGQVNDYNGFVGFGSGATGTATVTGVNANGTASTWTNGGVFEIGFGGTGTLTIQNGGIVSCSITAMSYQGNGTLNLNSNGMLQTNSIANEGSGTAAVSFNGGILQVNGQITGYTLFGGCLVTLGSGGGTIDNNGFSVTDAATTFSGTGALTSTGAGTFTLTGANTFSGGTIIQNGVLSIGSVATVGSAQPLGESNTVNFTGASSTSPGVLQYTGGTATMGQNLAVSTGGYGVVDNTGGGVLTLSGTLSKNDSVLTLAGGEFVVSGTITGTSANSDLNVGSATYPGGATVGLTTTNSYNGPTTVSGGSTLLTGIAGALPTSTPSAITLGSSTDTSNQINTLDLLGTAQTIASLTSTGSATNQVISSKGTASGTPAIGAGSSSLTGSLTVNYSGSSTDAFSGSLGDSNGTRAANKFSLIKTGTGVLALNGTNTYTGSTTVKGGTLAIKGSLASGSAVTVGGNGTTNAPTLTGAGTINGSVTLAAAGTGVAGTINPGTVGTVGTLSLGGGITFNTGTTFGVDISGNTNDLLAVTGNATLTGTLAISATGLQTAALYTLLTTTGSVSGTFGTVTGLPTGYTVTYLNGNSVDLQHEATISLGTLTAGSARILTGTSTTLSLPVSNTAPSGSIDLHFTTNGTSAFSGVSTSTGTRVAGASASNTSTIFTGGSVGNQTGALVVTDASATNSPQTSNSVTIDVVGKRTITNGATTDLGYVHVGKVVTVSANVFSTTGLSATTTSVEVGTYTGTADAHGLSLSGGPTGFTGGTSTETGTRTLVGTITGTGGSVSGSFNLGASTLEDGGAGLTGEGSYSDVTVAYSANVYTGNGVWNAVGGGSWGTISSLVNWTADGGAPGLDASFNNTDTATFGGGLTGPALVTIDNDSPSLAAITFNNSTYSYEIGQGTGIGILKLNGGVSNATITDTAGTHLISAPVQLDTNTTIQVTVSSDTLTISGVISGGSSITKTGSGTLILSNTNTYSGGTTIDDGTLSVDKLADGGSDSGIGASSNAASNLVLNGGALQYTGSGDTTNRSLTLGANGGTLDSSGTGAVDFTNATSLAYSTANTSETLTLTGTNTGANTLNAAIGNNGSGATSVVKNGTGNWQLTGTNTYTGGTTINQGNLFLNGSVNSSLTINSGSSFNVGSGSTVNGNATVGSGGTLGGKGTINGNVTVQNHGTLFPGDPSITTVDGNVTLDTGATSEFSIANSATASTPRLVSPGTDYDQVAITGASHNLTINSGVTLEVVNITSFQFNSVAYVPTGSNTGLYNYFVLTVQSGVTTGHFDFLSDGTNTAAISYSGGIGTVTLDNVLLDISYTGNFGLNSTQGGHDVVLSAYNVEAVPEPSTWVMFALGLVMLFLISRRRKAVISASV
jgi:autotransporter-associated beta strand protein